MVFITRRVSAALLEAAGDAALLVDSEDTAAIAAAMRRMLDEPDLRAALRARLRACQTVHLGAHGARHG